MTPLVTTPYVTRTLGETSLGAYGWTQSICVYFTLAASLGISMYGQRETAYVREDPIKRNRLFEELFFLRLITVSLSTVPYLLLFATGNRYSRLFLIHGLELAAVVFDISWFLQGMENFRVVVLRNAAVKIISVLCIFLLVKGPEDIGIYALCQSGAVMAGNISLWICLPGYLREGKPDRLEIFHHLVPVLILFLPQIAIQVYNEMDKTMLGLLAARIEETAYYTQGQKIIKVSQAVVKAAGAVMLPRISYLFSYYGEEKAVSVVQKMFRFAVFMGSLMAAGIIGVSGNLVPWFLGKHFLASKDVLIILAPTVLLVSLSNVSGIQCLIPLKKQKEFNLSVIGGAFVNLIINMAFIPRYGAIGACAGTLVSECVVLCIQLCFIRRMISLKEILKETWRYLVTGVCMMLILFLCLGQLPAKPIVTFGGIVAGGLFYGGALLLLKDPLVIEIKERIGKVIRRRMNS